MGLHLDWLISEWGGGSYKRHYKVSGCTIVQYNSKVGCEPITRALAPNKYKTITKTNK